MKSRHHFPFWRSPLIDFTGRPSHQFIVSPPLLCLRFRLCGATEPNQRDPSEVVRNQSHIGDSALGADLQSPSA